MKEIDILPSSNRALSLMDFKINLNRNLCQKSISVFTQNFELKTFTCKCICYVMIKTNNINNNCNNNYNH